MRRLVVTIAAPFGIAAAIAIAEAQSLADVARREAERRKSVGAPGRAYTNKDLARTPSGTGERVAPKPAVSSETSAAPAVARGGVGDDPGLPARALEDRWRLRVDTQREALARAEVVAAALQSRINALTTDSVNRDDPAQRAVLLAEREAAVHELERVQQEIVVGNAALAAMLEEARRAGIPAGWVRERGR